MDDEIVIRAGVPAELKAPASSLYCTAFDAKLTPFLGSKDRAARFLAQGLATDRAIVAIRADQIVGIAGFKRGARGLFEPGFAAFWREYGWTSLFRIAGLAMLERAEDNSALLMDGIAVDPSVRGQGIGTRLLEAIEAHAREQHLSRIRLDVIDTNPGARRLYERFGFEAIKTSGIGPFRLIFPFRASTQMHKQLS